MGTLANSEDPDEMLQIAAFHQGLHCFLRQSQSSEKEIQHMKIITFDPIIYTIDHPHLSVSTFMENSIGLKRVIHMSVLNSSYVTIFKVRQLYIKKNV